MSDLLNPDQLRSVTITLRMFEENLLDTQSTKLKRFGKVDPGLESVLDPPVGQLAQLALELAAVFDEHFAA